MTELLHSLEGMIDMTPVDENTSRELRGKIDRAVDNYHNLNAAVVRIETRFAAAEEKLASKITEIAESIKSLTVFGQDIQEIRLNQRRSFEEHDHFRDEECKHKEAIDKIESRIEKYELIIKVLAAVVGFLSAVAVPVVASMAKHVFSLPP